MSKKIKNDYLNMRINKEDKELIAKGAKLKDMSIADYIIETMVKKATRDTK